MRYSDLLLDHFYNPRHVGEFPTEESGVYTGRAGDYQQGDIIQLQLKCSDENMIMAARFKAYGCVPTLAIASYMTEWLIGKTLQEAKNFSREMMMQIINLPKVKLYCALLAEDALTSILVQLPN